MERELVLICDDCGLPIEEIEEGYAVWAREDRGRCHPMIVHDAATCPRLTDGLDDRDDPATEARHRQRVSLRRFTGDLGLMSLVADSRRGRMPPEAMQQLILRLHVPGFEQYRLHREGLLARGFDDALPETPTGDKLRKVLAGLERVGSEHLPKQ